MQRHTWRSARVSPSALAHYPDDRVDDDKHPHSPYFSQPTVRLKSIVVPHRCLWATIRARSGPTHTNRRESHSHGVPNYARYPGLLGLKRLS
jgi:hypothetical protein